MAELKILKEKEKTRLRFFSKKLNQYIDLNLNDIESPFELLKTDNGYELTVRATEVENKDIETKYECLGCSNSDYGG